MRDDIFTEQTKALGLRLREDEAITLARMLAELAELFRPVDEAPRVPSEDPLDFMRTARELRDRRAR